MPEIRKTAFKRESVTIATAGEYQLIPYGGTYFFIVSAKGNVTVTVGEDAPTVIPIGEVRIMPPEVEIGKDAQFLRITSDLVDDEVEFEIGYGAGLPLDILLTRGLAVFQNQESFKFPNDPGSSETVNIKGSWPWLRVKATIAVPGDEIDLATLIGGYLDAAPFIYNQDGTLYNNAGQITTNGIYYVQISGSSQLSVTFQKPSGLNSSISGDFFNGTF